MKFESYLLLSDADILSFQLYKENSICLICKTKDEKQILGLVEMDDSYFNEDYFQSLFDTTLELQYSNLVYLLLISDKKQNQIDLQFSKQREYPHPNIIGMSVSSTRGFCCIYTPGKLSFFDLEGEEDEEEQQEDDEGGDVMEEES